MVCNQCGSNAADGARFCQRCGTQFSGTPQDPARTAPPPPPQGANATPPAVPAQAAASPWPNVSPAQPMYGGQPQTDSKAIGSLILGILSVTILWIFAGIPAVILGHISRSQIQKSMGRLKGEGMALAGLIMGYLSLAALPVILIIAAIAIPNLIRARMSANETAAAQTMRTLVANETAYSIKYPANGYAQDLATLGPGPTGACAGEGTAEHACLIDATLGSAECTAGTWCTRSSFRYIIVGEGGTPVTDFVITATPVDESAAMKSYCATADGVLRRRMGTVTAPLTVAECLNWASL